MQRSLGLISFIISYNDRGEMGHFTVKECWGVCSVKKQPPSCLDTFRKKETKGSSDGVGEKFIPSFRILVTGQCGRKPVNELTTLFVSILSCAVMHVDTQKPTSVFDNV